MLKPMCVFSLYKFDLRIIEPMEYFNWWHKWLLIIKDYKMKLSIVCKSYASFQVQPPTNPYLQESNFSDLVL